MSEISTKKLNCEEAAYSVAYTLYRILHKEIECKITIDDWDYWAMSLVNYEMPKEEIKKVCEYLGLNENERKEAYASDGESSVTSFGLDITEKLLGFYLKCKWERAVAVDDTIYLIGCSELDHIFIDHENVYYETLKTKQQLIDFLTENPPNERSLAEFCHTYCERYGKSLYWHFPFSDTVHLGAYIVLVREGVLYLPYNQADSHNFEVFCLEDIFFISAKEAHSMMVDYENNAQAFRWAFDSIMKYLIEKEKKND